MKSLPCRECNEPNLISNFVVDRTRKNGYKRVCRTCDRVRRAKRYYSNHGRELRRHRADYEKDKNYYKINIMRYQKRYPEKVKARLQVRDAIKAGTITRLPCQKCGAKSQAHHPDYSKPLEVVWLCQTHHSEVHRKYNFSDAALPVEE